ncbi:MAG: glycine cleavage T C-terminal barrel domain-containing protein, partial [Acetobacteraceae bacterium]
ISSVRLRGPGGVRAVACDALLMSGGWTPSVHLFSQSRGRLRFDDDLQAFVPGETGARARSAGGCRGTYDIAACLAEGHAAGEQAARGVRDSSQPTQHARCSAPRAVAGRKAFVDFQNDVTVKDLMVAVQEGFRSIEHIKRYTTTGMATDQGKTSNLNALSLVADVLKRPVPTVGHTTFRMPYTPVTFGAFAGPARGALFEPVRHTPTHDRAVAAGAVFEDVGTWKRARFFSGAGEDMHAAVARECRAVRTAAGLFDGSTLGKIEVTGPDAGAFLDRIYTGSMSRLGVGRCRYGLMLSEAGFVMDDGVVARLAPDRFHLTTTTGGAAAVLQHMEDYAQTEFPELCVWLTSITEQWAVIAVQGPHARDVIAPVVGGVDISPDAMPHMSVRECRVAGIPARLFRVSFTGERGFEINVPAGHGPAVWDAVWQAGAPFGIVPYGTEAMHVLRAEKGYIVVGQETDGTVTPGDLDLGWTIGRGKDDFVGKRSLARRDMARDDRRQLVGLLTADPGEVLEEGSQITEFHGTVSLGHVTSAYFSATLGRSMALALVSGGRARRNTTLYLPTPDQTISVRVTDPVFYDRKGARLHG